ncbi:hypothetical protein GFL93_12740 [Rhizobium leguminosarum bv. viciae]|uniref:hypothetical protein n=1 Tax=Rhizobium TaxID=379 RepID=UPI001441ECAA|nr:hypothetical protein [Rhizobium leguminosarum]NKK06728.1 hypothetical protein [Rhizobium leguminosarum bv. viciae]
MERTDFALVTNRARPIDMASEHLFGHVNSPAIDLPSAGLLEEFKTAAQEFVDAADAGAELDRFVKWFRELLA